MDERRETGGGKMGREDRGGAGCALTKTNGDVRERVGEERSNVEGKERWMGRGGDGEGRRTGRRARRRRRRSGLFSGWSDSLSEPCEVSGEISGREAGGERAAEPGLDECQGVDVPQTWQEWEVTPAAVLVHTAPLLREPLGALSFYLLPCSV